MYLNPEATLVVLRESLEAFLIVSIFTGLVVKFGKPENKRYLLAGAGSALLATIAGGFATDAAARQFLEESGAEPMFAGIAALVAAVILTYMIVWMYRHTLHLVRDMHKQAVAALEVGKPLVLFLLAFVAVAREGIETILFYATLAPTTGGATLALSALAGLVASATLAYLVFTGIVRLSLQKFFAGSGILLVLFAGGLLAGAIADLSEAGIIHAGDPAWSTKAILDKDSTWGGVANALVGYQDSPTWPAVVAYGLYVLGIGAWYLRGVRMHTRGETKPVET